MGNINITRMLLGGLFAGLVICFGEYVLGWLILGEQWAEVLTEAGTGELGGGQIGSFAVVGLLYGRRCWSSVWDRFDLDLCCHKATLRTGTEDGDCCWAHHVGRGLVARQLLRDRHRCVPGGPFDCRYCLGAV